MFTIFGPSNLTTSNQTILVRTISRASSKTNYETKFRIEIFKTVGLVTRNFEDTWMRTRFLLLLSLNVVLTLGRTKDCWPSRKAVLFTLSFFFPVLHCWLHQSSCVAMETRSKDEFSLLADFGLPVSPSQTENTP